MALLGDKAYSARAHRAHLRVRGVTTVIPEPADQAAHRKRRGSRGGRPVRHDPDAYRGRNVIERAFNQLKHWRALATRYDCEDVSRKPGHGLTRATTGQCALSLICRPRLGLALAAAEPV